MRTMGDWTESISHGYSIAEGHDPRHTPLEGYGELIGLTAGALYDIYQGGEQFIDIPSTAGEQLVVVSNATGDSGAGASGIRTLTISYLDTVGTTQLETITMNATSEVSLTATGVSFVQYIHTATIGSAQVSDGNIYIYQSGTTGNLYDCIIAGENISLSARRKVPTGQKFFMTGWDATVAGGKDAAVRLRVTALEGTEYPNVFMTEDICYLDDSVYVRKWDVPIEYPENTIIKISARTSAGGGGADITAGFRGWLHA